MEELRRSRKEESKRLMPPRMSGAGGCGIHGLIVWGGALATAGLIAAFSIKRRGKNVNEEEEINDRSKDSCQKEEESNDGLRFVLQASPSTLSLNPCSTRCEASTVSAAQVDDCTTGNLINMEIIEENHVSSAQHQEILLSDEGGTDEEFSFHVLENAVRDEPEKMINIGNEPSLSMEAIEVKIHDETVTAEEITEEGSAGQTSFSLASLTEEEEETSEQSPSSTEEEDVAEKSAESSEETGSSKETDEAIWPAEMIDASSSEHRKTINYQNSAENFGQRDTKTTQVQELNHSEMSSNSYMLGSENGNADSSRGINNSKETQELIMVVPDGKHQIRWRIMLCSVVLPLMLLLLANWIIRLLF